MTRDDSSSSWPRLVACPACRSRSSSHPIPRLQRLLSPCRDARLLLAKVLRARRRSSRARCSSPDSARAASRSPNPLHAAAAAGAITSPPPLQSPRPSVPAPVRPRASPSTRSSTTTRARLSSPPCWPSFCNRRLAASRLSTPTTPLVGIDRLSTTSTSPTPDEPLPTLRPCRIPVKPTAVRPPTLRSRQRSGVRRSPTIGRTINTPRRTRISTERTVPGGTLLFTLLIWNTRRRVQGGLGPVFATTPVRARS